MIDVVVADDHEIVRRALEQLIASQPDMRLVGSAGDGAEVLALLAREPCRVLVLDLSLPQIGGLEIVRQVVRRFAARVVIFSMYPEDQLALHLLEAGAYAYLNKSRSPKELLAAVRAAANGQRHVTPELDALERTAAADKEATELPHRRLSPRESQVFLLLLDGVGVSDIARQMGVAVSTASNHVTRIKEKLGVDSIGKIIRYGVRVGLVRDGGRGGDERD